MNPGFKLLEKGKFQEAKAFFKVVLKEIPKNKTARLCYGRAVGLSGAPKEATNIFISLLKDYPSDIEVQLNYAESLLWGKKFNKAKKYYTGLVEKHPKNFAALLGFANTLSNLKEYTNALIYVNKALKVSPGNPNAMISKKFIRLGYAYSLQQKQTFKEAIPLLKDNLIDFPNDKQTLVQLANLYIIMKELEKAKDTYITLATSKNDSILSFNGLSLINHLQRNEKQALKIATDNLSMITSTEDIKLIKSAKERYTQALIWNKKFPKAKKYIDNLKQEYPNENWVLALSATLNMYKSEFNDGITTYKTILKNDEKSFDGNLGIANAFFANDNFIGAYRATEKTLDVFPKQKDAIGLQKKLIKRFTPSLEQKIAYSFDSGNNNAITSSTQLKYPLSTKLALLGDYSSKYTENNVVNKNASSNHLKFGINYLLFPGYYLKAGIGINKVKAQLTSYNQFLMDFSINMKPIPLHQIEIGYVKKLEKFNAELLDRKLVSDNIFLNYNLKTHVNLGWYVQYFYTSQNDNNGRHLLFTSLYYTFSEIPVLKGGINYQFITFKNQVPTIYFSPSRFNNAEIFLELLKDENGVTEKKWFYHIGGALGLQKIENDPKQLTYRIQSKLGYKFNNRLLTNLYAQHTNIASATAAGFSFTEVGFRFVWHLSSKTHVFN